ncbi:hypothetical protein FEM48_Zijuj05G0092100 [Ziziphus jujuba var. spinosa]|uniref:Transcription repressor n=1 Tax=Ziziphus jujuba var. spinosa TaxID=714518 RepID=A0A978VE37_ZIZJJ|nr:hypothetical protein FEM48_Zijuj05G0092100 [Ziziphus jujuba var. spinosa]
MISEEKVDSFNVPLYNATFQQAEAIVDQNGYFSIEIMESLTKENPPSRLHSSGLRAGLEDLIKQHFGDEIDFDKLFDLYCKKFEEIFSTNQPNKPVVLFLLLKRKVKGSFAVVKKSNDPHNDFRTSMVEMIVEKQIFSAKDLEQLLPCFLSLNSHHHHKEEVQFLMNPTVNRHPNLVKLIGQNNVVCSWSDLLCYSVAEDSQEVEYLGIFAIMFKNINNRMIEVYNPIVNIPDHDGGNTKALDLLRILEEQNNITTMIVLNTSFRPSKSKKNNNYCVFPFNLYFFVSRLL